MAVVTALNATRVLFCGDGLAVAEIGPVCVVIWRDAVTRSRFEKQKAGLAEVVARHQGEAGFLCIVEPTAAPPDDQLRRASTEMIESHENRLKCVAGVIEGSGFKAAVTRSVMSGMALLLARRQAPVQYFARVDIAARWMAKLIGVDPPQFVAGVEALRARLAPVVRKLA